ncbi:MAG: hypothetical protein RR975_02865 [Clostridia bacterium]
MKRIDIPYADGSEYVFFPACCYNGNRFEVLKKEYPPLFEPYEAGVDIPVTITDVPRLEKDGSGCIQITTGDLSVPCVGIFNAKKKRATFVFTVQQAAGKNIGMAYRRGVIELTAPAYRDQVYHWPHMVENTEPYEAVEADIPMKCMEFECADLAEFYQTFLENRKCMGLDCTRPQTPTFAEQFRVQCDKFNRMNWQEKDGFYDVDTRGEWQPGWVGGAMSGYALMKLGGRLEAERAVKTLHYLFANQAPCGLFYGMSHQKCDGFGHKGAEKWLLVRKSADCLYFAFKHFQLMKDIPQSFLEGTRKLAERFVSLWEQYHQFGQFVDCDNGEITVGGSTCGAIVPAALAESYRFFHDARYLNAAMQSAEMMFTRDAAKGYTTGGPGEILQGPDSESAFALLESMVVLYEVTQEKRWLVYAQHCANLCASWVVSYNYVFPPTSEFGRLQMKTVGCVFANVQNKHAAPGICTLSGNSLYKLYQWTGNELYRELFEDIALSIGQFMSTKERPICSWQVPEEALVNGVQGMSAESVPLPEGFICERVNMSDWETKACVGGVFCGSCWCETSNLLTMAEYPTI